MAAPTPHHSGPDGPTPKADPQLGELLRQLAADASALFRQEVQLARLEVAETVSKMARDALMIVVALGVVLVGGLLLLVAAVLGIGELLGGAYWAGALIMGGILLLAGALVARSAGTDLQKRSIKPETTIRTLKEQKEWAREEIKELTRGLSAS